MTVGFTLNSSTTLVFSPLFFFYSSAFLRNAGNNVNKQINKYSAQTVKADVLGTTKHADHDSASKRAGQKKMTFG